MLGGPLGALLGAALGSNLSKGRRVGFGRGHAGWGQQERIQTAFFTATFSVMGNVCKADGYVSESEIDLARQVMQRMDLSPQQEAVAMALFNQGKKRNFPIDDVLAQLRREVGYQPNLQRMFIEIQLYAAYADGVVHPAERAVLLKVSAALGVARAEFESLAAAIGGEVNRQRSNRVDEAPGLTLKNAYAVLNISAGATDVEVKRAYRRLTSQHHPDKLVSKGMPEEMMQIATRRTREIRDAYERIREARGF